MGKSWSQLQRFVLVATSSSHGACGAFSRGSAARSGVSESSRAPPRTCSAVSQAGAAFETLVLALLRANMVNICFLGQVDDCGFSLNHPNQFFLESQRILTGGKDFKKESSQPETPQHRPSVQKTKDAASALASLNSSLEMELEGLEDYFNE